MPNAFVAVDERVIHYQREAESRSFFDKGRIKILAAEAHPRLRNGRLQRTQVADSMNSSGGFNDKAMEVRYLRQAEVAHQLKRLYRSRFFWST